MSPTDVSPYLFYADVDAAARFLQDAFGFTLGFTSRRGDDAPLEHAQLHHGERTIMLGRAQGGMGLVASAKTLPKLHASVYVFVDDVDAHHERARAAGATIAVQPGDQPWGDRMYAATDPEGQFWMFARRLT